MTAHNLLEAGAYISSLDLNENKGLSEKYADRVKFVKVDITKDKEVEVAVEKSVAWTKETGAVLGGVTGVAGWRPWIQWSQTRLWWVPVCALIASSGAASAR